MINTDMMNMAQPFLRFTKSNIGRKLLMSQIYFSVYIIINLEQLERKEPYIVHSVPVSLIIRSIYCSNSSC